MKMTGWIYWVLAAAFASGCSTFSKQQCEQMNWENQGYVGAYEGYGKGDRLNYYIKECGSEHGIQPNPLAFEKGYARGLESFCTSQRATEFAAKGGDYKRICPKEKEPEFLNSYMPARVDYLTRRVAELESENSSLQSKNSSLESEVSGLRSEVSSLQGRTCP